MGKDHGGSINLGSDGGPQLTGSPQADVGRGQMLSSGGLLDTDVGSGTEGSPGVGNESAKERYTSYYGASASEEDSHLRRGVAKFNNNPKQVRVLCGF